MGTPPEPAADAPGPRPPAPDMRGLPGLRTPLWIRIALCLCVLLPSLGTLGAPWIADDALILERARAGGWLADWVRPQGGLALVRFWRPVVSTSWGLQEAWTGIDPLPLRAFNLLLHAGLVLAVAGLARRLGAGPWGAGLAGVFVAFFPHQGGTVTWLAGRTDELSALTLVGCVLAALGPRPWLGLPLGFLALASKEFGLLAPLWIALCSAALRESPGLLRRRVVPAALGVGVALLWRRAALGDWVGGYAAPLPLHPGALAGALGAGLLGLWPTGVALLALAGTGLSTGTARPRAAGAALACALLGLGPLLPLLAQGPLAAQNQRLLLVPEVALALAVALACARLPSRPGMRAALLAGATLFVCGRGLQAWRDTHEWARAAQLGEQRVSAARRALEGTPPAATPVLFADLPVVFEGAYCLGFGLAQRFRAPFPATPRPVWPLRPLFPFASGARAPLHALRADGTSRPFDDPLEVTALEVRDEQGRELEALTVDERAFVSSDDRSPHLVVESTFAGAALECVVYTECGLEAFAAGALDPDGGARASLMQLLQLGNGVATLGQTLAQAADLGARRAYLELRVLGPEGSPLAASRWIELGWSPELARRTLREG